MKTRFFQWKKQWLEFLTANFYNSNMDIENLGVNFHGSHIGNRQMLVFLKNAECLWKLYSEQGDNGQSIATTFTITVKEPHQRWEFDIENNNMKGHWTGILTEKEAQTELDVTEDVTAKKWWMKPFVRGFLKKQQKLYISDLRKALE